MQNTTSMVSIIFPVKNEGENVKKTLDSLFTKKTNYTFEVIIVNDGSTDNCCEFLKDSYRQEKIKLIETKGIGAANARNLGADFTSAAYLIFCDAHIEFEDWWIDRLLEPLIYGKTDAISPAIGSMTKDDFTGFGQTLKPNLRIKWNPKPAALNETAILPGACLAIKKNVFDKVGGFERGFKTWGHEDIEFSIRLWLFGYKCHILPTVKILHLFRKKQPYNISYEEVNYNLLRLAYSHFNAERIKKCKKLLVSTKAREIELKVLKDGVLNQRRNYFKKRTKDDDWYFNKFKVNF